MNEVGSVTIILAVFGALVTVIQGLGLYILSDIRRRVERLETNLMENK